MPYDTSTKKPQILPLFFRCRVTPVQTYEKEDIVTSFDKEKYRDLWLDAAETVLGYFGFDGSVYRKFESRGISSSI